MVYFAFLVRTHFLKNTHLWPLAYLLQCFILSVQKWRRKNNSELFLPFQRRKRTQVCSSFNAGIYLGCCWPTPLTFNHVFHADTPATALMFRAWWAGQGADPWDGWIQELNLARLDRKGNVCTNLAGLRQLHAAIKRHLILRAASRAVGKHPVIYQFNNHAQFRAQSIYFTEILPSR